MIVDDHPAVRMSLAAMLSADDRFSVVGEAGDGEGAVEVAGQRAPDVVLMDLRIPGGGVEATIEIFPYRERNEGDRNLTFRWERGHKGSALECFQPVPKVFQFAEFDLFLDFYRDYGLLQGISD